MSSEISTSVVRRIQMLLRLWEMQAVVPPIFQEKCKSNSWWFLGLNCDGLLKEKSDCFKFLYYSQNNHWHSQATLNNMSQNNVF